MESAILTVRALLQENEQSAVIEDMVLVFMELECLQAQIPLRITNLIAAAAEVMGVAPEDLSDWTLEDLMMYADLAQEAYAYQEYLELQDHVTQVYLGGANA